MKLFGLEQKHITLIKNIFEKYLSNKLKAKVYIYGSRATGKTKKFSDIDIVLKLKDTETNSIITKLKSDLEESDLPYKIDLVNWHEIAEEYLPQIKKQKIPFWSPDEIDKKSPWRICPIGKHWTKTHPRHYESGTISDQSGHCKKNPSGKDLLKSDEIEMIPTLAIFQNSPKPNSNDLGYPNGNQYDNLIAGWVAYWNDLFHPAELLDPDMVKILIASESSFIPDVITPNKKKTVGNALGLSQITESTVRILSNRSGEIKDNYIDLKSKDMLDPNKNISACIRWLFRKRETAQKRLKREPSWEEVLWEYKGITTANDKKSLEIKNKLHKKLELLKKK